jgi:hypothetical protein
MRLDLLVIVRQPYRAAGSCRLLAEALQQPQELDMHDQGSEHHLIEVFTGTANTDVRETSTSEVFTFGAELGKLGLAGGLPTG